MNTFHSDLQNRWYKLSIVEQMSNIGAEVGRSINWKKKGNKEMSINAFYRALELIDFTISDPVNSNILSEILRVREFYTDYLIGDNQYKFTDESWEKYFLYFNLCVASSKKV